MYESSITAYFEFNPKPSHNSLKIRVHYAYGIRVCAPALRIKTDVYVRIRILCTTRHARWPEPCKKIISHPRSGSRFISLRLGMSLSIGSVGDVGMGISVGSVGDVGMSVSIGSAGDAIRCMSGVHTTDNEHTDCWTHAREMSATH